MKSDANSIVDFSKIYDGDLYIATGALNGGFVMSVYFGPHLICVGEHKAQRLEAMAGLRDRVENMMTRLVVSRGQEMRRHNRGDSEATLGEGAREADSANDVRPPASPVSDNQPNGAATDPASVTDPTMHGPSTGAPSQPATNGYTSVNELAPDNQRQPAVSWFVGD